MFLQYTPNKYINYNPNYEITWKVQSGEYDKAVVTRRLAVSHL